MNTRDRQKSDRRTQLLTAAEQLIAERGFLAVRLEDIGAAAGVSGPAIYRHFSGKEGLLVELLVEVSTRRWPAARPRWPAPRMPAPRWTASSSSILISPSMNRT